MYKRSNNRPYRTIHFSCVERAFDNLTSQGYTINDGGFIRNDFSELQARENEIGYLRALSQMQDYVAEHSNEGKTFEEIIKEVRPRWCQLNGEVDRFEQYLIDNALEFYKKLRDADTSVGAVAKDFAAGVDIPVTDQPATVKS